jgi:uncharacterized cupredoxin-like copper-binding protein
MQPRGSARNRRPAGAMLALAAATAMVLTACQDAGSASDSNTVVMIPNYQSGGQVQPQPQGYTQPTNVITVVLGESDPNTMYIRMSDAAATEGPVSFIVTNEGTETHEFVVLQTDIPAAAFPIVSFEGEKNRIDEDARGVVNAGETGDMEPGTTMMMTLDVSRGHYAIVCNLPGHYANGMHKDFWVVPPPV